MKIKEVIANGISSYASKENVYGILDEVAFMNLIGEFPAFITAMEGKKLSERITFRSKDVMSLAGKQELPYKCKARKRFNWSSHPCKLEVTTEELKFIDQKDNKFSFSLTIAQLKQAKINETSYSDIVIKLNKGISYEIGLDSKKIQDEALRAIRTLLER